jgi:hypothetical protein
MKRQMQQPPPYSYGQSKTNKVVLPVTLAILGASAMLMAVMLITSENTSKSENGSYDVENYDIVGNRPFIYSICE